MISRIVSKPTPERYTDESYAHCCGENQHEWKGDDVSKSGLHKWVRAKTIEPDSCSHCGKTGVKLDVANISGIYRRNVFDFDYLCRNCHAAIDKKRRQYLFLERKMKGGLLLCTRCNMHKPPTLFYKTNTTSYGYLPHCKACHGLISKKSLPLVRETKRRGKNLLCTACKKYKHRDEFYPCKKISTGKLSVCIPCEKESQKRKLIRETHI